MAMNYKQVIPMYAVLMAALTFTVSSVPGQTDHESTSLSSESADSYSDDFMASDSMYKDGCDVQRTFSRDAKVSKAACPLAAKVYGGDAGDFKVRGSVKVEFKKITRANEDRTDNEEVEKMVISITTSTDGLATRTHTLYRDRSEWSDVNSIISEAYDLQAEEMSKKVLEHQRVVNCDIDINGSTVTKEKQPACRLEKLSNMGDSQGEAYYNKYFKNDLETLLKSTDPAKQAKGMEKLALMEQKGIRSKYVLAQLETADLYVKSQLDLASLNDKMKNMSPEQRRAFLQTYGTALSNDVRARLTELDNTSFGSTSANNQLADSLAGFATTLSQHFNEIVQMHADSASAAMGRNAVRVSPDFQGQVATGYQMGQRGTPVVSPSSVDTANGRSVRGGNAGTIPGRSTQVDIK